jgi:hypothetical protein
MLEDGETEYDGDQLSVEEGTHSIVVVTDEALHFKGFLKVFYPEDEYEGSGCAEMSPSQSLPLNIEICGLESVTAEEELTVVLLEYIDPSTLGPEDTATEVIDIKEDTQYFASSSDICIVDKYDLFTDAALEEAYEGASMTAFYPTLEIDLTHKESVDLFIRATTRGLVESTGKPVTIGVCSRPSLHLSVVEFDMATIVDAYGDQ